LPQTEIKRDTDSEVSHVNKSTLVCVAGACGVSALAAFERYTYNLKTFEASLLAEMVLV
jgi:hypothetical protein